MHPPSPAGLGRLGFCVMKRSENEETEAGDDILKLFTLRHPGRRTLMVLGQLEEEEDDNRLFLVGWNVRALFSKKQRCLRVTDAYVCLKAWWMCYRYGFKKKHSECFCLFYH